MQNSIDYFNTTTFLRVTNKYGIDKSSAALMFMECISEENPGEKALKEKHDEITASIKFELGEIPNTEVVAEHALLLSLILTPPNNENFNPEFMTACKMSAAQLIADNIEIFFSPAPEFTSKSFPQPHQWQIKQIFNENEFNILDLISTTNTKDAPLPYAIKEKFKRKSIEEVVRKMLYFINFSKIESKLNPPNARTGKEFCRLHSFGADSLGQPAMLVARLGFYPGTRIYVDKMKTISGKFTKDTDIGVVTHSEYTKTNQSSSSLMSFYFLPEAGGYLHEEHVEFD
jgi:hypothetical protein